MGRDEKKKMKKNGTPMVRHEELSNKVVDGATKTKELAEKKAPEEKVVPQRTGGGFGDVAMAPPELSFKPKNLKQNDSKFKDLKMKELLQKQESSNKNNKINVKKRKAMSEAEKVEFDQSRQSMIDAYRNLK